MEHNQIMEVTTFRIKPSIDPQVFSARDAEVEQDFTSKQPGFVKRQSGIDGEGNYVVVVFWESKQEADASMNKFMSDPSVEDYAAFIDPSSMKMSRYTLDNPFSAEDSHFVEIMAFNVIDGTDKDAFSKVNKRVETEFTGKRNGFKQRLTGSDDSGKQVVAVYWLDKKTSDASLQPFMDAPIAKEFMQQMDQSTMSMGRYAFLNQ